MKPSTESSAVSLLFEGLLSHPQDTEASRKSMRQEKNKEYRDAGMFTLPPAAECAGVKPFERVSRIAFPQSQESEARGKTS